MWPVWIGCSPCFFNCLFIIRCISFWPVGGKYLQAIVIRSLGSLYIAIAAALGLASMGIFVFYSLLSFYSVHQSRINRTRWKFLKPTILTFFNEHKNL
jgi:hypothetical protein